MGGLGGGGDLGAVEGRPGFTAGDGQPAPEGHVLLQVGDQGLLGRGRILPRSDAQRKPGRARGGQDVAGQLQGRDVHADERQRGLGPQPGGEVTGAGQLNTVENSGVGTEVGLRVVGEVGVGLGPADQSGHGDVTGVIVAGGDQSAHGGGGIQHGAAVHAGVKRVVEHVETDVNLDDAAQRGGQGRDADLPVGGVGHDDDVGGQAVAVSGQEVLERGAAHLLLTLDEDRHGAGQLTVGQGGQDAQGVGVGDDTGLVVSGSASEQPLPTPLGGEGVGLVPAGRVADGLNVVVGVEQDVRAALGAGLVGQDGGPTGGAVRGGHREDLGIQTAVAQERGHGLGGALDLGLVVAGGGDRGNRDQVRQVGDDGGHGGVHGGAHGINGDHGFQGIAPLPLVLAP